MTAPHGDSRPAIVLLFPELLGTYGDGGNAVILAQRLRWRGIGCDVLTVGAGDAVPEGGTIYLLGGGEDGPQVQATRQLARSGAVHRAVEGGAVLFAVCAGMQIAGVTFPGTDGRPVDGLGLLDCTTERTDEPRAVGELWAEPVGAQTSLGSLTGFENHGGRTTPGPTAEILGTVRAGVGNGNGTEGVCATVGSGRAVGTYLHGPALARNPSLADRLLADALGTTLEPLPEVDAEADALRNERLAAVQAGHLDGVAHRTWRDRLLRRN
ncbi:MAG: glutamine amidotransferase [Acidimicrobiia bacterium]|nr:glutamine amidotransferase [Acidimicrobiia bacterium]